MQRLFLSSNVEYLQGPLSRGQIRSKAAPIVTKLLLAFLAGLQAPSMPTLSAAAHRYAPLRSSEPEDPVRLSAARFAAFQLFDGVPGSLHDGFQ